MAARIAVYNDDAGNLRLFQVLLQKWGYDVLAYKHTEVDIRTTADDDLDLIILAYVRGYEEELNIVRELRAFTRTADLPIAVFTTNLSQIDRAKLAQFRPIVCVEKPFTPRQLHSVVTDLIGSMPSSEPG